MFTREFWKAAAERAGKTFFQFLAVLLGGDALAVVALDWRRTALLAAAGLLLSVVTSLASALAGLPGPSLATEQVAGRHRRSE